MDRVKGKWSDKMTSGKLNTGPDEDHRYPGIKSEPVGHEKTTKLECTTHDVGCATTTNNLLCMPPLTPNPLDVCLKQ